MVVGITLILLLVTHQPMLQLPILPSFLGKATGRRALLGNGAGGGSLYLKRKINVYIASLLRNMAPVGIGSIVLIEEVLDAGTECELI